ncbi:MAG: hypothetical protein ACRDFR_03770 [Candidatus Limnocylindria bacterium]
MQLRLSRLATVMVPAATTVLLLAAVTSALAASGPAVRGGGVVDGPLGTTSQLGFTATSSGGSFLCVMAGRSGGFPFGPWESIQQMHVQGEVTPGSLSITGGVATFSGTATIHVIGTTSSGIFATTLSDVPFVSMQAAGGAGVAWHLLDVPGIGAFGPEKMKTGRITIWP